MRGIGGERSVLAALVLVVVLAGCGSRPNLFGSPTPILPGQTLPPGRTLEPGQTIQPTIPNLPTPGLVSPGLTGAPAAGPPSWLAAGTRLTWYVAAASVANSRFSIVEDPDGDLEDPRTGKRYRRTDTPGGEGQPGASGDGYSQVDVVGFDGTRVALSMTLFGIDHVTNLFFLTPIGGAVVEATTVDGAWASPGLLANAIQNGFGDLLLLRGPYLVGDTSYDTLSFVSGLGTSTYSSYSFDMPTGILVSANTSTGGVTSPFHVEGEDPPVGNSQLTMARFTGMRARPLPGAAGALPEWVARTSELDYTGTYNWINPVDPSSGNLTYPMQHGVTIQPGGAGWQSYSARTVVTQMLIDSTLSGVAGPASTYWYAPEGLAQMSAGDVLDTDPITGEQLSVAAVGGGQVVLESRSAGLFTSATYDAQSGQLVAYVDQSASSGVTVTLQLAGTR